MFEMLYLWIKYSLIGKNAWRSFIGSNPVIWEVIITQFAIWLELFLDLKWKDILSLNKIEKLVQ